MIDLQSMNSVCNCSLLTAHCSLFQTCISIFFTDLIGRYGLYAVFLLVMIEGDLTLLLAGVLAHSYFFGDHSFAWVLLAGTLGGSVSDNIAYLRVASFAKAFATSAFIARPSRAWND